MKMMHHLFSFLCFVLIFSTTQSQELFAALRINSNAMQAAQNNQEKLSTQSLEKLSSGLRINRAAEDGPLTKLSSGLRINRAADDAVGLATNNDLTTQTVAADLAGAGTATVSCEDQCRNNFSLLSQKNLAVGSLDNCLFLCRSGESALLSGQTVAGSRGECMLCLDANNNNCSACDGVCEEGVCSLKINLNSSCSSNQLYLPLLKTCETPAELLDKTLNCSNYPGYENVLTSVSDFLYFCVMYKVVYGSQDLTLNGYKEAFKFCAESVGFDADIDNCVDSKNDISDILDCLSLQSQNALSLLG